MEMATATPPQNLPTMATTEITETMGIMATMATKAVF